MIRRSLAAAVLVMAVAAPASHAHSVTYKPTVASLFLSETFLATETNVVGLFDFTKGTGPSGQLRKCEKNRKGIVYRQKPGRDAKAVSLKTDKHGNISQRIDSAKTPAGTYYGKYPKRVLKNGGGHKHVCKGATTKKQDWAGPPAP